MARLEGRSNEQAVSDAWQIHSAICDWTDKADTKATFLSAIDVAMLAGVIAFLTSSDPLADLDGFWQKGMLLLGVGLLGLATGLVLWVVAPHLGTAESCRGASADNFVFFGHVQHWEEDKLTEALREVDVMPILSKQLIVMSKIAWLKHKRVQYSVWATSAGGSLLVGAVLLRWLTIS